MSVIRYILYDIIIFVILGDIVLIGFSIAFYISFADRHLEGDPVGFGSPMRTFETLFYAVLGEFDAEVGKPKAQVFVCDYPSR